MAAAGRHGGRALEFECRPEGAGLRGQRLGDERRPQFVASDEAVILNETRSGWVWTVPDGELVPSSQDWSLDDRTNPDAVPSDEQLTIMIDPKPPVAEPDAFGVRADSLVTLPVLLNDHDPNEDVLSIDPASVTGLDPGFGVTSITDDGQRLAVRTHPRRVGLRHVLLRRHRRHQRRRSALAADDRHDRGRAGRARVGSRLVRSRRMPRPVARARGRARRNGDGAGAARAGSTPTATRCCSSPSRTPRAAAASPRRRTGDVVFQHADDGSGAEELLELAVTVSDTRGATTTRPLLVRVSPEPKLTVQPFAVVDTIDAGLTVDVAPHVTGTAGALALESVRVLDGAAATATVVGGTTGFDFSAETPGTIRVGFTVTDGISDADGMVRITMLPADAPPELATAPVVAFVHPKQDATLDVFAAVSNPTRRVLLLSDVIVHADDGASLSVDTVGQNNLRVSGTPPRELLGAWEPCRTPSATAPRTAARAWRARRPSTCSPRHPSSHPSPWTTPSSSVRGRRSTSRCSTTTSRPAGGRPTLDPSSVVSSSDAALAFASGDLLRYLAPDEPGEYRIQYSVYTTGSPTLADTADVRIQVLADDANRAPLPEDARGARAERAIDAHRVRRIRHGPRWRRRDARPDRDAAGKRRCDDLGRRRIRSSTPASQGTAARCRSATASSTRSARRARGPSGSESSTASPTRVPSPSPTTSRCRRALTGRSA